MTPAPPDRSLEQRRTALAHANEIRVKRAMMKRDLKAGRVKADSIVERPPSYAATMTVVDLLLTVPKIGRTKANRVLVSTRISPSKTLAGLSQRQRSELAGVLSRGAVPLDDALRLTRLFSAAAYGTPPR